MGSLFSVIHVILKVAKHDQQWVSTLKLLFLNDKAAIHKDPEFCAREIAKVLTINDYLSLGEPGQLRYRSAALQVGDKTLAAVSHANVSVSAPAVTTDTATILFPCTGIAVSHGRGDRLTCQARSRRARLPCRPRAHRDERLWGRGPSP